MNQEKNKALGITPIDFANKEQFKQMNKAMCEMLPKLQHGWEEYTAESGGKIVRHILSDESTFKRELGQLSKIVKRSETAYIIPELTKTTSNNFYDFKNPDTFIKGKIVELKKQDGGSVKHFFKNHFTKAAEEQMADVVVMEVNTLDWKKIEKQLDIRWKGDKPKNVLVVHEKSEYLFEKIGGKIERLTK